MILSKRRELNMKKMVTLALAILLLSSLTFSTAFAFNDVDNGQKEAVTALKDRGIVSGMDILHFVPKGNISYAQSVQMIVKGLDLNMDLLRFIKQPLATDFYTNISNDAWYANAFIIAHYIGLDIPKEVNPNSVFTREQFGDLLVRALEKKGDFPLIKMFIQFKDEDQITSGLQSSLQRLVLYKIAELDKNGKFYPKRELTRGEAASWLYNTIHFLEAHPQQPVLTPVPAPSAEVTVNVEKVSNDVNKVTLSRGEKPNAGYGIEINSIRFAQDGQAVVTYTLSDPKPDMMYVQVITTPKAETFISSKYKVVAEPAAMK
jgi:hypothetical protein